MASPTESIGRVEPTLPRKIFGHQEGIWGETISQDVGLQEIVFRRPLPMQLIAKYSQLAVRRASLKRLPDGNWFAEIPGFEGVWSREPSAKEALDVLEEVVKEWILLKIQDEDRDLPVIETINLNVL